MFHLFRRHDPTSNPFTSRRHYPPLPMNKFGQTLERYLEANTRISSRSTINHYRVTFRQYAFFLGRPLKFSDLNDDALAGFLRALQKGGSISAATVNQKRNYVCAFWRWLFHKNLVRQSPTVSAVVEPERIPEAWTLEEVIRIFQSCRLHRGVIDGIPAGDWWLSLNVFWFYTGERVTASLNARWRDLTGTTLVIHGQYRKGKKPMVYELREELMEVIETVRKPQRELIWPWQGRDLSTFYLHYHKIVRRASLPYVRWKTGPHKMRRAFASYLEAAGGDASKAMAHTNTAIAIRSYIDPRIAKPRNYSVMLPEIVLPTKGGE